MFVRTTLTEGGLRIFGPTKTVVIHLVGEQELAMTEWRETGRHQYHVTVGGQRTEVTRETYLTLIGGVQ